MFTSCLLLKTAIYVRFAMVTYSQITDIDNSEDNTLTSHTAPLYAAQQHMHSIELMIQARRNYNATMQPSRRPLYQSAYDGPGYQDNFSGARTGGYQYGWHNNGAGGMSWRSQPTQGYALDQNRNGRFDRGRDAVLVFDMNRDGRYDDTDVQNTRNMMRAATGDIDFNNDGYQSLSERMQGATLRAQYSRMDRNRDGVLNTHEIAGGGGKGWIDHSRGGAISNNELYSPFSMPNASGWGPSQRLDAVNPFARVSHTSNNWSWNASPSPWPVGGHSGGYGYNGGYGYGY